MTLKRDSATVSSLTSSGQENNPLVAYINDTDLPTYSTDVGTLASGYAAANAGTYTTFDRWGATPNGSGQAALQMTYASAQAITWIGMAVHNLGTLGATVRPQYSTNGGSTWSDTGAATVSPVNDRPIAWQIASTSAADWRLFITGLSGGDTAVIGHAFAGQFKHTFGQRFYQGFTPAITANRVESIPDLSEGNELLGTSIVRRGSRITAAFEHLDPTDMRGVAVREFLAHYNDGKSFFFAWRPSKYDGDLHFGWRPGGVSAIQPTNAGPAALMALTFEMQVHEP